MNFESFWLEKRAILIFKADGLVVAVCVKDDEGKGNAPPTTRAQIKSKSLESFVFSEFVGELDLPGGCVTN